MKFGVALRRRAKRVVGSVLKRSRSIAIETRGRRYLRSFEESAAGGASERHTVLFRNIDDKLWLWLNTEGRRNSNLLRDLLPSLPEERIQVMLTGLTGDATLRVGHLVYTWVKDIYAEHMGSISSAGNILDFGCGWGRVIRFFLKDVTPENLWGADPVSEFIEICRQTNPWCRFELTSHLPPTRFEDNVFGLIFCNSVFSHFSERIHEEWLRELRRILRPGGILIATTWPRDYIENHKKVIRNYPEWMRPTAFVDSEKHYADYDNGRFCYSPMELEGSILDPDWGEACISQQFVMSRWARDFEILEYVDDAVKYPQRNSYHQNVIVARKNAR